ncbi:MAG TPA: hypothetical protein VM471_07540 [Phenylobacterium sp.]|jgi:hypothetical protein|nr:hypothetical protein [Phenylobacterium sp.]
MKRLVNTIRNLPEHLRFKYGPRAVQRLVHWSTFQARRKLPADQPLGILVDNSVRGNAVTHESRWVSAGPKMWGPHEIDTGYMARVPVHTDENDTEIYENLTYLSGIVHLGKTGRLRLCTSAELRDETSRQPSGLYTGYGYFDHSLFAGVNLECIDKLEGGWVLGGGAPPLEDQQQRRLSNSNDPLYHALLKRLGPKQNLDAWHIRTAEKHGLFCFLTMDFKLRRTVERWKDYEPFKSMKTKVMTPAEFGKAFELIRVPPRLHSYTNASFFVRSDLHMPGEKRRSRSAYGPKAR